MRNRVIASVAVVGAVVLALTGCGEDSILPTPPLETIAISPEEAEIAVGDSVQFTAQVQVPGAGEPPIRWESGDTVIATVDSTGMAFGHSPGETTVTVKALLDDQTKSARAFLTVVADTTSG